MDKNKIRKELEKIKNIDIIEDALMSKYTTMKVGGKADFLVNIKDVEGLKKVKKIITENNIKYFVLGNGSNVVVRDGGFDGIIIRIKMTGKEIIKQNDKELIVNVEAGVKLMQFCMWITSLRLWTFSRYIWYTCYNTGGAIRMNAGAYEKSISDYIITTTYMDQEGKIVTLEKEKQHFGYRRSIFANDDKIILSAELKFSKIDKEEEIARMKEILEKRKLRHPMEYGSSGSVFKRNENLIPAKEIDEAGLKGMQVGGMQVSEKHAGFIINKGNGTAKDFEELSKKVKDIIYEKKGCKLELEPIVIGKN